MGASPDQASLLPATSAWLALSWFHTSPVRKRNPRRPDQDKKRVLRKGTEVSHRPGSRGNGGEREVIPTASRHLAGLCGVLPPLSASAPPPPLLPADLLPWHRGRNSPPAPLPVLPRLWPKTSSKPRVPAPSLWGRDSG